MAMQLGGGARGGRRLRQMSEINVTPFVDVMLVLLIVFMVTAPLLTVGVQVDLPKTVAPTVQGNDEPLAITVDASGRLFLMETEVEVTDLVPRLLAISQGATDKRIFVRGDRAINYGRVMEVMGLINSAGFSRVALVAVAPNTQGGGN
jgi:biopolymer transport protein TolR